MPEFSTILQDPAVREVVQQRYLERAFHDALFPNLMFRSEVEPEAFGGNLGDSRVFTAPGLLKPKLNPIRPGDDPTPSTYGYEQWEVQSQQWGDAIDTHLPTAIQAVVNLFLRNAQQLGLAAGQSLNRLSRNAIFNAAHSGWSVASAQANATATTVSVRWLNGLTRARRPDLAGGSQVRFDTVSAANPLPVTIVLDDASLHSTSITGFTADTQGDEVGPGTITIANAIPGGRNAPLRTPIYTGDRSYMVRVGGGFASDAISTSDIWKMQDMRTAVARLRRQNVPMMADGRYHGHMDPVMEGQIFADTETQSMLRGLPDYFMYREFAIGDLLGVAWLRNNECPLPETVTGQELATPAFSQDDPLAMETYSNGNSTTGTKLHQAVVLGAGSVKEYYIDQSGLITEAGLNGKMGAFSITNNGIEINTDRISLIFRAPQNRFQDQVSAAWRFMGGYAVRTDIASGDGARYKRQVIIQGGEA